MMMQIEKKDLLNNELPSINWRVPIAIIAYNAITVCINQIVIAILYNHKTCDTNHIFSIFALFISCSFLFLTTLYLEKISIQYHFFINYKDVWNGRWIISAIVSVIFSFLANVIDLDISKILIPINSIIVVSVAHSLQKNILIPLMSSIFYSNYLNYTNGSRKFELFIKFLTYLTSDVVRFLIFLLFRQKKMYEITARLGSSVLQYCIHQLIFYVTTSLGINHITGYSILSSFWSILQAIKKIIHTQF